MATEKPKRYLGLELNTEFAMISSATDLVMEPETISRIAGSEAYQIPTVLCKRKGLGQWFYGDEAERLQAEHEVLVADDLLRRAIDGEVLTLEETDYPAEELLALFLQKVLDLPKRLGANLELACAVVTMSELTLPLIELMKRVLPKAGLRSDQVLLIDDRESFYYYALSQPAELSLHEVALFELNHGVLRFSCLQKNERTTPKTVLIEEKNYGMLYDDTDRMFREKIEDAFAHRIVTTSYLTGDGFDGGWMKESLKLLCRGRKAFLGRNLYSKGACYAALIKSGRVPWDFVYMGENTLKLNVSLKVRERGELSFVTLLSAGESWYEADGEAEIILCGEPEIDFWLQEPDAREAKIQTVTLLDFPEREDKTTRLRITAKPVSDREIKIVIKDLGFGEFVRTSEKSWEYLIHE